MMYSQNSVLNDTNSYDKYRLPSISIGPSFQSFYGDLGEPNGSLYFNTKFRSGITLGIEKRLHPTFGLGLNALYGKLSDNEWRKSGRHLNFETNLFAGDLRAYLHLDNGKIFDQRSRFSANLFAGIGAVSFNPYGDLKGKGNKTYYYWNDGTIRDAAYDINNPQNGTEIKRDYDYETKLDSLGLYSKMSWYVPLGVTVNYKLSDRFETNVVFAYNYTGSDYIDNHGVKSSNGSKFNDGYFQCQVTLQYNISGKSGMNKYYKGIKFGQIDDMDSDGDKIADIIDECPGTPAEAKVDKKGCPIDTDKDGVADYIDQEANTSDSARVNEFGVTMTDSMYLADLLKDSLKTIGEWDVYASRLAEKSRQESLALVKPPVDTNDVATNGGNNGATEVTNGETNGTNGANNGTNGNGNGTEVAVNNGTTTGKDPAYTTLVDSTSTTTSTKDPLVKDATTQKGVVFRIQIASSATKVPASYFKTKFRVTQEVYVSQQAGVYKYAIGNFNSYEEAKAFNEKFKQKYNFGSFITPYKDGARITIQEALVK